MKNIKTIIVDDHDIIRFALKKMLERHIEDFTFDIVGEADTGRMAVDMVRRLNPDLVIMNIMMPEMDGIEATRQIRQLNPACKIIILTAHSRRQHLRELIYLGISGYVLKSHVFNDLFEAIRSALRGEIYLSSKVAGHMAEDYADMVISKEKSQISKLSPRQREVLQLMTEGKGTKEIAAILNASPKAIESIRHRIMQKLKIDNLADLTKYAIQEGLTTLDF